jgi:hypothetical protein
MKRPAAAALSLALAACGGNHALVPSSVQAPAAAGTQARARGEMTLRVHVPRRVRRRNHFVSPATQSLALSIVPAAACGTCSAGAQADVGLTPGLPNCTGADNGTTCTITVVLNPGNYTGSISTYDGPAGCQTTNACATLSTNQSFPLAIAAGKANAPSIALYGVVKGLQILPASGNVAANANNLYVGGISSTGTFALYGTDADRNLILGPGSPTFSLPSQPANGWSAAIHGNLLSFTTSPAFQPSCCSSPYTLDVSSPSCTVAGAKCSFTIYPWMDPIVALADSTNNEIHILFMDAFAGHYSTYATIKNGINVPSDVKFDDSNGDLFVANAGNQTVTVYAPPYTGAPVSTFGVPAFPSHIAVDGAGNVAVAYSFFGHGVNVYSPPSYASPQSITLSSAATSIAFAYSNGSNLWVATSSAIASYASPYGGSAPSPNLSVTNTSGIDLDSSGDLYVADATAGTFTEYKSPGYSAGTSVTGLSQPTNVSVGVWADVCTAGSANQYYPSLASLASVNAAAGSTPCLIASDYTANEPWEASAVSSSVTQFTGPGTFAYFGYVTTAIAAFPSPRIDY